MFFKVKHSQVLFIIKNLVSNEVLLLLPVIELTPHFDTKDECYFYFTNTVVKITKDGIFLIDYDELDGYVFAEQIIDKEFKLPTEDLGKLDIPFRTFVYNIANIEILTPETKQIIQKTLLLTQEHKELNELFDFGC